jgi:hypothetical protein
MLPFTHLQRCFQLAFVTLAFTAAAAAQVGIGLAPMREELKLAPGVQHSGVLIVTNDTAEKVRVVGELLDFYIDSTPNPQFGRQYAQESPYSCRQWLSLNPMEMELEGHAHVAARYTVRAPQAATDRSYHCAIGFTTQPTAAQAKGTGLRAAVQVVAAIYVVIGQPAVEGSVKDLTLEYVADPRAPGWKATVVLSNAGLMHYRPIGDLDVLDSQGKLVQSAHFVPLPVLPKRDQNFVFPLKLADGPGKYTLRARVDLGGNEIQEATALVVAQKPK